MDHARENFLPLLRLSSGSIFLGEKVYRAEHRAKTQLEEHCAAADEALNGKKHSVSVKM
jgi:hypothetical protein